MLHTVINFPSRTLHASGEHSVEVGIMIIHHALHRSGRAALLQAKTMYDFGSLPPLVLVLLCAPVRSAVSQVSQAVRREGSFYRPVPAHNPSWR